MKLPRIYFAKVFDLRRKARKGLLEEHPAQMITGDALIERAARFGGFISFDV